MKKLLLTSIIGMLVITGFSQLNNSWIDFNKTYYKFRIGNDTLSRIYQPALPLALAGTPAQNFQLWRNGKEVPLYTSVATGVLGANDYIEFWGLMNDGKPDKNLYRNPDFQLSEKFSLESDTAVYYLTVNPSGNNLRYTQSPNIIAGNSLPADPYFMRRIETNFKTKINNGYAAVIGEYVYSASYDQGEGWTCNDIAPCCALTVNLTNLNVYTAGPPNSVILTVSAAGNALNARELFANFYSDTIFKTPMPFFGYLKDTIRNIPLSKLLSTSDLPVSINGNSDTATDRIVVSCFSVTYPATFNFNNEKNFYFELKNNAAGNYLVINNFNSNGVAPILYDYNNSRRYLGDISTPGQVKFVLPPSSDTLRKFNLMSQVVSNINSVTGFTTKTFTNFANAANQGDYLIISNSVLYNDGTGVNNVELYRQYRASINGGGFNAKIYDINELTEQFGFGIKKHPSGIRDFIRYVSQQFSVSPKYVFIIGRGMTYTDYTINQNNPADDQLNLVQTFGFPASDILLSAAPGTNVPLIPIGRLGAINGSEVGNYYRKMLEYEAAQRSTSQTIADKGWMKNFLHTIGPSTPDELIEFLGYVNSYKQVAEDTLYGAHVETFAKSSVSAIEQQNSQRITELFQEGLSYVKYFGHSSANELAINLNYPENYSNAGKYPFMHVSGCTVGNFFTFNPERLVDYNGMSLSEKYILLNEKGSIGFLGSTHWGIPPFLNNYNTILYNNICRSMYGNTIGNQLKNTIQTLGSNPATLDYYTRVHLEEINLQGDPALKINAFAKPDYVIEDQLVKFTPNIITVADNNFVVDVQMMNIGRAIKDSMRVIIKQQLPDNSIKVLYNQMIPATLYMDSVHLVVHINPNTDKGLNKLIVSLDDGNRIDELSENNNILIKEFYIFEDELNPVSPYNYSIVNQQNISFYASTANAISGLRQYVMELDTTELFNSSFKKVYNASGIGGIVQFNASNISFTDSTVYYWRTSTVPSGTAAYIWNSFSFIYLANSTPGFNQSHYYQFLKNTYHNMQLDNDRVFRFAKRQVEIGVRTAIYPYAGDTNDFSLRIDGLSDEAGFYAPFSANSEVLRFYVIDTTTTKSWKDIDLGTSGLYGSVRPIPINSSVTPGFFQFKMTNVAERDSIMKFLDLIPNGNYVVVTNCPASPWSYFPTDWRADTAVLGSGNSLYHKLRANGFSYIDSLKTPIPFVFVYKKGAGVAVNQTFGKTIDEKLDISFFVQGNNTSGDMTSDKFGPAKQWNTLHWRGRSLETPSTDSFAVQVFGIRNNGVTDLLASVSPAVDTSLSWINAQTYPYLQLKMLTSDTANITPYQLRYWRINATYVPEGAVAPNILFTMKDTVEQGEMLDIKLAFKNISSTSFDSLMRINITITDKDNHQHIFTVPRGKKLVAGDTLVVSYQIDTRNLPGINTLFIEVNPNNDQPEQYHFNNVLYKDFYVKADAFNPLLDVTFDGVHILNKDIVSAKPHILVRLKDESRFLALSDTSFIKVQVRFPDGSLHGYSFGDTLRFTPANLATGDNTASIDFTPVFLQDGEYELIVSGRDVVGNIAGALDYNVIFTVISKPMISNLMNYPNPFTTSTAFVFTITGNSVPQNIRIQVLTITGKVVREITIDELGPLHVGRNITEFKWDGTDMYGAKLANGVYLYRVLTNLNGKSLDKYKADGDQTDKYFNNGYGKMVILR